VRTRLCLSLLLLLSGTQLHAQYDTATVAGRVLSRRIIALEQDPAITELAEAGILDFDSWDLTVMDDATLIQLVRLMAVGLEREERRGCPVAMAGNDGGDQLLALVLAGVTDSTEAEQWADVVERAVWGMAGQRPVGTVAAPEEIESRLYQLLENLTEEDAAVFQGAAEDPGGAACMMMRVVFQDLAGEDPAVAAPLIRALMTMGLQARERDG
jgi:hypothetical protein